MGARQMTAVLMEVTLVTTVALMEVTLVTAAALMEATMAVEILIVPKNVPPPPPVPGAETAVA
jgi:hypothetical protein